MSAITHQRIENIQEATTLALTLYDLKDDEGKREMIKTYISHIAREYSVNDQRDLIANLKRQIERMSRSIGGAA